jgi:hypothetical protein
VAWIDGCAGGTSLEATSQEPSTASISFPHGLCPVCLAAGHTVHPGAFGDGFWGQSRTVDPEGWFHPARSVWDAP